MSDRPGLCRRFVERTEWKHAEITKIAGDASNRTYDRLIRPDGASAVLMNAPPEKGEDVRPFIAIARHLRDIGLSAPEILNADEENGFLLLEDLGDDLFSRIIPRQPELESAAYAGATEVLLHLHKAELPDTGSYDAEMMTDLAALALTIYARAVQPVDDALVADFKAAMLPLLSEVSDEAPVLILRDYHADNLLWLPARDGVARIGLLDFQDAMKGHRAYDLVSLLQDVRRDVPEEIEQEIIARYIAKSGIDGQGFRRSYDILGAQRALRILGVFARLGLERGRPHYVDMIPKVWEVLFRNLDKPSLAPVADLLKKALPPPEASVLARLKSA
jgi:aminoglycoside/choline kinase family phosphotransferase